MVILGGWVFLMSEVPLLGWGEVEVGEAGCCILRGSGEHGGRKTTEPFWIQHRGTSMIRNTPLLGTYSRTMPRVQGRS
jgi:hypothetical protein